MLLHVAGVNTDQVPLRETSAETFDWVIRANLRSAFLLSKAIAPKMVKGGRIIFVSSTSAARGLPGFGAYSASKGGLRALAGALAGEIAADGGQRQRPDPGAGRHQHVRHGARRRTSSPAARRRPGGSLPG